MKEHIKKQLRFEAITSDANKYAKQLAAVKQNGREIQFIRNPSIELQLAAVKQNAYAIEEIENPSIEVQLAAVNKDGTAIRFINNPSDKLQLAVIKHNGYTIKYIKNSSVELQLVVINQDGNLICYIKNPSLSVLNECKRDIIKYILKGIHDHSKVNIEILNKLQVTKWPELDVIQKSLAHDNKKD